MTDIDERWLILAAFAVFGVALVGASTHLVPADGTVPLDSADGPRVDVNMDNTAELNTESPFADSESVRVETSDGVVVLSSSGATSMTIDGNDVAPSTDLRNIQLNGRSLDVNPQGRAELTLSGTPNRFVYSEITLDDGATDIQWDADQGNFANVTVRGLPSNQAVGVFDPASGTIVDAGTTNSFGNVRFELAGDGSLRDGQLTTPSGQPEITNPVPADGVELSTAQNTIEFDVSHPDFGQSDVDLTTTFDGSVVDTRTVGSNQTVSISVDAPRGGVYDWSVEATDRWGQTTTQTFSFRVPDEIEVFDALNTSHQLVTGSTVNNGTVPRFEAEFFGRDGNTEVQTITNGTIDLNGLIVEDPMTIRIRQANESALEYQTRNVYIKSIYSQNEVYLIPGNRTQTENVIFELNDRTGRFGRDSILQVQRQVTKDFDDDGTDESRFVTMAGDSFDVADKREFVLLSGERYRLTLTNQEGRTRVLGNYDVTASVVEELEVGQITYGEEVDQGVVLSADTEVVNGQPVIKYRYQDADDETDRLIVEIRNLDTDTVIHQVEVPGDFGVYSEVVQIPDSADANTSYRVSVTAERESGDEELSATIGDVQDIGSQTGIPARLLQLISWAGIVAVTGLVAIFDDALASLIAWLMATALTIFGFITVPGVALAFAGGIAVIFNVARRAPVR